MNESSLVAMETWPLVGDDKERTFLGSSQVRTGRGWASLTLRECGPVGEGGKEGMRGGGKDGMRGER